MSLKVFVSLSLLLSAFIERVGAHLNGERSIRGEIIEEYQVPLFTIAELHEGSRLEDLADSLATTGLISVAGTNRDKEIVSKTRQEALAGLCGCMTGKEDVFASVRGADTSLLHDGTTRTTLATATVGTTPLPLSKEELVLAGCSASTVEFAEKLRDQVAWASHAFVSDGLDPLLVTSENMRDALLSTEHNASFRSVSSIVKASQNLEHFHIYSTREQDTSTSKQPVLDVHTDAGLFLAFVPGMRCDASNNESSDLYVSVNGTLRRAIFARGSVGIMLGVGAENWLRTSTPLFATRHAVNMQAGQSRAWYGMMHTVPQDAIIQDFPQRTFADMRKSMVLSASRRREYGARGAEDINIEDVAIGCGSTTSATSLTGTINGGARINRRRLQMVEDASVCNNATNFFCWMSCLDIPEAQNAIGYLREGYSLYCLEPYTLASSGNRVSAATKVCNENGVVGGAHNEGCVGSWQPTAPGVPAQEVAVDEDAVTSTEEQFCYGGTTMYMDGFHWVDPTCVIYLFPTWILTTAGSLTGACVGTIFFGMALEGVIRKRREVVQSLPVGWKRLGISTLFYGLQLTMGYMLMLVVMTYSGPLFMCVILGLMAGHFICNAGRAKVTDKVEKNETAKTQTEGSSDCYETDSADDCCRRISEKKCCAENALCVPEGSTPCCQNTL